MKGKKIISVVLSLVIVMSMCVVAFASSQSIIDRTTYTEMEFNGKPALRINVNVKDNPELKKIHTLVEVSKGVYAEMQERSEDGWIQLSLEHIVGELFMHVVIYNVLKNTYATNEKSRFHQTLKSSELAELDIDEKRMSDTSFRLIGSLILGLDKLFGGK